MLYVVPDLETPHEEATVFLDPNLLSEDGILGAESVAGNLDSTVANPHCEHELPCSCSVLIGPSRRKFEFFSPFKKTKTGHTIFRYGVLQWETRPALTAF